MIKILSNTNEDYPQSMRRLLGNKAPKHLTCIGNIELLKTFCIGISGSRKSSNTGLRATNNLTQDAIRKGYTIVSGGANGVDGVAHHVALNSYKGNVIYVIPHGIKYWKIPYWSRSEWNWERVLVISQFKDGDDWSVKRAMARNKVIIALSKAMVVVEAGLTGGTMDAGIETLKMGVPLFVMQYEGDKTSEGILKLLDYGATSFMMSKNNIIKFSEISEKIS